MYKKLFNRRRTILFKHFSNKSYSLFSVIGKEVIVGTLSVATLTNAKANGISTDMSKVTADTAFTTDGHEIAEVSVTATRAPLTPGQQSRMITVLNRDDIAAAPVQSVNDLLKYAAGVDVRQRGPVGAQTDVSIRGGNYEQITVLLNGINICDPQTGHNAVDYPVDIDDIERIEILEGPAARVYGTSSLLGAINIVTKTGTHGMHASAHAEGGSYGYLSAGARLSAGSRQWSHSLSGSYTRSDGYSRSKAGHLNMDYSGGKAFYNGAYDDSNIRMTWHAGMSTRGWGSNTFYSSYSDEQYEHTFKTFTAIQCENKTGKVHFRPAVYWNRNMDRFELFRNNAGAYPFNYHRTDVYGLSLNAYFDWTLGRTAFGAELRNEDLVSGNLGEKLSRPRHIHGTDRDYEYGLNRTNIQLVLEHNITYKALTLSAGLVAVKNSWSEMNMQVYPSIEANYRFGNAWKVYASWNTSLRMPSATELYYNSKGYNANRNLKPEKLSAIEVGTSCHTLAVNANAAVFFNHMTNLIDWITDTHADSLVLTTTNFGKINSVGAEANIQANLHTLLPAQKIFRQLDVAYTYINQSQKKYEGITSQYVLEYLRHKLTARLGMDIISNLSLDVYYRYQKRNGSYVTGYDGDSHSAVTRKYSPYSIVDVRLTWKAAHFSVYAQGNNITAHRYRDFGRLEQPGAWWTAGIKFNM